MIPAASFINTHMQVCNFCKSDDSEVIARGVDFEYGTCGNEFSYVRCKACGHLYLNPLPDPSELEVIYPSHYGNFEHGRNTALTFRVKNWLDKRYLAQITQNMKIERVLDVGCADGRMLSLCREVFPRIEVLDGVEFSQRSAALAQERGFNVHVGSIDKIELKKEYYDLIFLQQVIEHVYDPGMVIAKLYDYLRVGGRVCFEMPTSESIDRGFGGGRYWGGYHFPRHFNIFSERNFCEACRSAGFSIVSVRYRYQPIHWVWTVHNWMKEKGFPSWIYSRFHIKNAVLIAVGTVCEAVAKMLSGKAANMQVVVEK